MRYLVLTLCMVGCATAPPLGSADEQRLCGAKECYRLGALGAGWQVVEKHKSRVGYFDPNVGAVIQGDDTCQGDAEAVPLEALTDHLLVGYTDRKVRSANRTMKAGREALHTVLDARLDGVPLVLDLYVIKRNECVLDLSFVAPTRSYAKGAVDFQAFVDGFQALVDQSAGAPVAEAHL